MSSIPSVPFLSRAHSSSSSESLGKRDSWREQLAAVENYVAPAPAVTSLEDDVRMKEEFKYDASLEVGASAWISAVLGEELPPQQSFVEAIRSGVLLCRIVNATCTRRPDKRDVKPLISRIHNSAIA
ncbi:MAG: hypothetical protein Q8P67_10455, partial [archaeon]|nr:hypothetical protein [archaeon]